MNTSREVFEKKTGKPATHVEYLEGCNAIGIYNDDYILMLEEQYNLILEALKAIDESINDNCISDAQMMIKNIIKQVSGK